MQIPEESRKNVSKNPESLFEDFHDECLSRHKGPPQINE
jgi:hypothetical protein